MSRWLRFSPAAVGATVVLVCAPAGAAYAGPAPTSLRTAQEVPGVRGVTYRGVHVDVPSAWPVVDLGADPRACLRLDRSALYLGTPGPQQDCPAHAVGRADTIWLRSTGARQPTGTGWRSSTLGQLPARLRVDPVEHTKQAMIAPGGVELQASWGASSDTVDRVLSTAGPAAPASSTAVAPSASAAVPPAASPPDALSPATATSSSVFTGMGFDTCAAPSSATMRTWLASPYRTAGVYIGGSMRACPDGNLSASWVSQVRSMGWGLIPIYVGPQAPCVDQSGLTPISSSQASAQGKANADDAVRRARSFGLASGTPVYYDMEEYDSSVSGCSATVLSFVVAWTKELHALGYASGVYGGPGSLMTDMSRAVGTAGFVPPDDVWIAHWNGLQTTSDSRAFPAFPDRYWVLHQRLHQYSTLTQSWGGTSINIDANWLDGRVAGTASPVYYGRNVLGPGSTGFVFTGDMYYWRPNAPQGQKGLAYWTGSNGATESNGATWSPVLAPGWYAVQASIPATNANARASYTITDARGRTRKVVDQAAIRGYTSLGSYLVRPGAPITVHVGDDDASSTSTRIGADTVAFTLLARGN